MAVTFSQEKDGPSSLSPPLPPLPVIDISTFINPFHSKEERQKTTNLITQACAEVGFFYVTISGIPKVKLDHIISQVRELSRTYTGPVVPALVNRIWAIGKAAAHAMGVIKCAKHDIFVRCGPHTDYGSVTLLLTDPTIGDLHVWSKNGQWIKADPIPGTFLVNVGNTIERQASGLWESVSRRIICRREGFRVSVPCFYKPRRVLIRNPYGGIEKVLSDFYSERNVSE